MSILSVMSTLRTHPAVYQRHVHFDNTCNWISAPCPLWEHLQLIINIMSTFKTPSADYQHLVHNANTNDYQCHAHFDNTCNWLSASCPLWEHLQLSINVMPTVRTLATDYQCHITLRTPSTGYQRITHIMNTCNWLSASCSAWEHMQLIIRIMSTLRTPATGYQCHIHIEYAYNC